MSYWSMHNRLLITGVLMTWKRSTTKQLRRTSDLARGTFLFGSIELVRIRGETERAKHIGISYKTVRGTKRDLCNCNILTEVLTRFKNTKTRNKRKRVNCQSRCTCALRGGDKHHYCYSSDDERERLGKNRVRVPVSAGRYRHRGFGERARSVNSVVGFQPPRR